MTFFSSFTKEVIATAVIIAVVLFLRIVTAKFIRRYAKLSFIMEHRTNLVIKYIQLLITILAIIGLIVVWGVQKKDIFLTLSSVTTVVGVAMFAQWSILSNITSGIILFFFFPFRIGDIIQVHDKDFPIKAEIEDIKAFHIYLKTDKGELIYKIRNSNKLSTNDLNKYNTISTPMGGKFKVILPDGSLVVLNAASTLKYPVHFDEKLRKVFFTGEAYFEIAKLEDKRKKRVPFYVYSNDQIVEVLGTHFNINSYDNEEYSKTTLLEGSVKIINEKSAAPAKILKPGQQAVIKRGDIQTKIMIADEAQALAWKDGYFLFKNTNIKDVVNELERWYNIDIQYEDEMEFENITGYISRNVKISSVLKMLQLSGIVNYEISGSEIIIKGS